MKNWTIHLEFRLGIFQRLYFVKSVQIRSFFWSVFSPNTGKYGAQKTPYLDNFHAVLQTKPF